MTTDVDWTLNRDGTKGRSWNVVTGCDYKSEGCGLARPGSDDLETGLIGGCYAMDLAARLQGMERARIGLGRLDPAKAKYQNDGDPRTSGPGFAVTFHPHVLDEPLRVKKPTTWFANSMGDLLHKALTADEIAQVFAVMAYARQHTFQIFTKREERLRLLNSPAFRQLVAKHFAALHEHNPDQAAEWMAYAPEAWPLPNVWLGVSVETQRFVGIRVPALRATQAAVRMLSCEPLLEGLDLTVVDEASARALTIPEDIHWVIAGAESGRRARPMDEDWVRSLRDQCQNSGVAFFYKQRLDERGHKVHTPELDGRRWVDMPWDVAERAMRRAAAVSV